MMKVVLFSVLFAGSAFASEYRLGNYNLSGFDFTAPVVSATSAVSDKQVGMIIYDASSSQFKGLDTNGNWDAMTVSGSNQVTSSGTSERIERARISGAATDQTNCTTSSCTIFRQSGSWVSTVTRSSTGVYNINFTTGTFSGIPSCGIVNIGNGTFTMVGIIGGLSANGGVITTSDSATEVTKDTWFDIICQGPR